AAVADYTPVDVAAGKISKSDGPMTLTLARTPDILADLGASPARKAGGGPVLVGFAAETSDTIAKALAKRRAKNVDLIVANDVSRPDAGFDVETNAVTIIGESGQEEIPLQSKSAVASRMLVRIGQ